VRLREGAPRLGGVHTRQLLLVNVPVVVGCELVVEDDARHGGAFGFETFAVTPEHSIELGVVFQLARLGEADMGRLIAGASEQLAARPRQHGDAFRAAVDDETARMQEPLAPKRSNVGIGGLFEVAHSDRPEGADRFEELGLGIAEHEPAAAEDHGPPFWRAGQFEPNRPKPDVWCNAIAPIRAVSDR
jgi:hypothetical protein